MIEKINISSTDNSLLFGLGNRPQLSHLSLMLMKKDLLMSGLIIVGTTSLVGYFYQPSVAVGYGVLNLGLLFLWSKLSGK